MSISQSQSFISATIRIRAGILKFIFYCNLVMIAFLITGYLSSFLMPFCIKMALILSVIIFGVFFASTTVTLY